MASAFVAEFRESMALKANLLLKDNIDGLLRRHGYQRKDLAQHCRRTEGWISKIFRNPNREIQTQYLDRIADLFGLQTYQLFQPGIVRSSERRKGADRRHGVERRMARRYEVVETQTSQTRALPPVAMQAISSQLVDDVSAIAAKLTELSSQLAQLQAAQPKAKVHGKKSTAS